jgi:hypothetical protein
VTVIRGVILGIGILALTAACTSPPEPCGEVLEPDGKFTPAYCPGATEPAAALAGIGIICGTILLIVLIVAAVHVATSWRHTDDGGDL